jgi:hypothetical protein
LVGSQTIVALPARRSGESPHRKKRYPTEDLPNTFSSKTCQFVVTPGSVERYTSGTSSKYSG